MGKVKPVYQWDRNWFFRDGVQRGAVYGLPEDAGFEPILFLGHRVNKSLTSRNTIERAKKDVEEVWQAIDRLL